MDTMTPVQVVNVVHKIGLEHWSYRQAMEGGHGVCIYD